MGPLLYARFNSVVFYLVPWAFECQHFLFLDFDSDPLMELSICPPLCHPVAHLFFQQCTRMTAINSLCIAGDQRDDVGAARDMNAVYLGHLGMFNPVESVFFSSLQ
jgi:hypothetical protein